MAVWAWDIAVEMAVTGRPLSIVEAAVSRRASALRPVGAVVGAERARAARAKFLAEHTHDDEVRFFAGGSGIFYLHIDGKVHAVLCEPGDLLSVPAGTTHWFDMGTRPDFTGDLIASRIPDFDTITAGRARG